MLIAAYWSLASELQCSAGWIFRIVGLEKEIETNWRDCVLVALATGTFVQTSHQYGKKREPNELAAVLVWPVRVSLEARATTVLPPLMITAMMMMMINISRDCPALVHSTPLASWP